MKITSTETESVSKVLLNGRLDASSSAEAERLLLEIIAKSPGAAVFDLSSLEYVSSAGLRVLLVAAKRAQQKGAKLALFGLNANVREVFDISGFSAVFKIFPDEAGATASFKA